MTRGRRPLGASGQRAPRRLLPLPDRARLRGLRPVLERALEDALATVHLVAGFELPDFEQPYEYLALRAELGYPIETGTVVTTAGRRLRRSRPSPTAILEHHLAHSNALHATLGRARLAVRRGSAGAVHLNSDRLSSPAKAAAAAAGLGAECRNPFRSIVVRAVELVEACRESLRIIADWPRRRSVDVEVPPRAGVGCGASEAPRGVLFHRYELDGAGLITDARIVPPTSQNQAAVEADLATMAADWADLDDHALQHVASRRSATTTRASPAPPTSST